MTQLLLNGRAKALVATGHLDQFGATGAYAGWLASAGTPADRRRPAETVHAAGDTLTRALARAQERWGSDPSPWLTFGMTLAMSQRILAEVSRPIGPAEREPA